MLVLVLLGVAGWFDCLRFLCLFLFNLVLGLCYCVYSLVACLLVVCGISLLVWDWAWFIYDLV